MLGGTIDAFVLSTCICIVGHVCHIVWYIVQCSGWCTVYCMAYVGYSCTMGGTYCIVCWTLWTLCTEHGESDKEILKTVYKA